MGKTENGAIWLDEKYLSAYDYWQFWRNIDDRDVIKFLKMFTEIEIKEIETIKDKDINELKILLANKTTEMLHGKEAAKNSEQAAKEAFSGNILGSNLPKVNVQSNKIEEKINIVELVLLSKLENSKSEIRRLLKGNAVKINDNVILDENLKLTKIYLKITILNFPLEKKGTLK